MHEVAKQALQQAVEGRRGYSTFLERWVGPGPGVTLLCSVVGREPEAYRDIRGLMERCQALVATRCQEGGHCTGKGGFHAHLSN